MTSLYRHFSKDGSLLYVGVADRWAKRLHQHESSPWFSDISSVTVQHFETRKEAISAERIAVVVESPVHNKHLKDSAIPKSNLPIPQRRRGETESVQFNIELPENIAIRVKQDAVRLGVNLRSYSLRAFEQFLSKPINSRRVYFEKQDRKIRGRSISA